MTTANVRNLCGPSHSPSCQLAQSRFDENVEASCQDLRRAPSCSRWRPAAASTLAEAQQQLYPAETALAQTQRDQLLAVVNLYKALGGGWGTP